jgi:hypothetical protein
MWGCNTAYVTSLNQNIFRVVKYVFQIVMAIFDDGGVFWFSNSWIVKVHRMLWATERRTIFILSLIKSADYVKTRFISETVNLNLLDLYSHTHIIGLHFTERIWLKFRCNITYFAYNSSSELVDSVPPRVIGPLRKGCEFIVVTPRNHIVWQ